MWCTADMHTSAVCSTPALHPRCPSRVAHGRVEVAVPHIRVAVPHLQHGHLGQAWPLVALCLARLHGVLVVVSLAEARGVGGHRVQGSGGRHRVQGPGGGGTGFRIGVQGGPGALRVDRRGGTPQDSGFRVSEGSAPAPHTQTHAPVVEPPLVLRPGPPRPPPPPTNTLTHAHTCS